MTPSIRRTIAVAIGASALTILSGWPLLAQDTGKTKGDAQKADAKPKAVKKAVDPTRRVPSYFGQLGLTSAQKESIYKIEARHQPRIDELEKQIDDVRAQSLKECEAVLTETQRRMLAERRAIAAETRAKKVAAAKSDD